MTRLVYPDGETLVYSYDQGGLLRSATGLSEAGSSTYIKSIHYDEFGQRTGVTYGNGAESAYEYDARNRRLTGLTTVRGDEVLQNIRYEYDRVGNILSKENSGFRTGSDEEKSMRQSYAYDDLHRLISSTGSYEREGMLTNSRLNKYTNSFTYDSIGNILSKEQVNIAKNPATGAETAIPSLTYTLSCQYNAAQPHAVSFDGNRTYTCDQNGNMTGYASADNREWRKLYWDDENRLTKSEDNAGTVEYAYDDAGIRTKKKSPLGETLYVNANYSVRNGEVYSKHIFAGNTRLATKMEKRKGTGAPTDLGLYYYHGDHLGSSNAITNRSGNFHEHVEYFPYGETWVEERVAGGENMPHKFTGKELDPETGLYYYGYRCRDPKLGGWLSVDPAFVRGKYFPTGRKDEQLPGMGGVFNSVNLNVYHYAGQNPVKFVDPDGNDIFLYFWFSSQTESGAGHVATGVGTASSQVMFDPYPSISGSDSLYKQPLSSSGSMKAVMSRFQIKIRFYNDYIAQDKIAIKNINGS